MNRYLLFLFIVVAHLQLSSCKDEDEGPAAIISFTSLSSNVNEGSGSATISLTLDRAPSNDLTVNFTTSGSATLNEDYTFSGSTVISKGSVEASIQIGIIDDNVFEYDLDNTVNFLEKLEITLSAVTGNGKLSEIATGLKHTIYFLENDPEPHLIIDLSWKDMATGDAGDVDMDLLFWYEADPGTNEFQLAPEQYQQGTKIGTDFEKLGLSGINPDTNYGLTFLYFEGSATEVEFTVKFTASGGTLLNGLTEMTYTGTYTTDNINGTAYDDGSFQIEQVFSKVGFNYPTISELEIPSAGSRTRQPKLIMPQGIVLKNLKGQ